MDYNKSGFSLRSLHLSLRFVVPLVIDLSGRANRDIANLKTYLVQ